MPYLTSLLLTSALLTSPAGHADLSRVVLSPDSVPFCLTQQPVLADFRKGSSRRPKGGKKGGNKKKSKSSGGRQVYA